MTDPTSPIEPTPDPVTPPVPAGIGSAEPEMPPPPAAAVAYTSTVDRRERHVERVGPRWWHTVAAAVLGGVVAVGGMQLVDTDRDAEPVPTNAAVAVDSAPAPTDAPVTDTGEPAPGTALLDPAAVGAEAIPSIVTVQVGNGRGPTGTGSGVIISDDGLIVTNHHVIDVGTSFQVVMSDGRTTYQADLVGSDPLTDLAVLDIDIDGLDPIEYGATSTLAVGDPAIAVGSPLGLEGGPSLSVGVVSAFGRRVQTGPQEQLYGMLQTDAPITQGSSGGALVDRRGRLIGITTAVGVSSVGIEGIGFATPIEIVERVVDELIAEGGVTHAFLGITGTTGFVTADDGAVVAAGVEIETVEPGSAADAAGLDAGDLITAIDGNPVETMDELIVSLRVRGAGDAVTLSVDGVDVPVELGRR